MILTQVLTLEFKRKVCRFRKNSHCDMWSNISKSSVLFFRSARRLSSFKVERVHTVQQVVWLWQPEALAHRRAWGEKWRETVPAAGRADAVRRHGQLRMAALHLRQIPVRGGINVNLCCIYSLVATCITLVVACLVLWERRVKWTPRVKCHPPRSCQSWHALQWDQW